MVPPKVQGREQSMSSVANTMPDYTVTFFLIGTSVTVAGFAIAAGGWKHKWLIRGLLAVAALLIVLAFTWQSVSRALPAVGSTLSAIAAAGGLTLIALVAGLTGFAVLYRKFKSLGTDAPSRDAAPDEEDVAKRLSRLEHNHGNLRDKFTKAEPQIEAISELGESVEAIAAEIAASQLVGGPKAELDAAIKKLREDIDLANRRCVSIDEHVKREFEGVAARIEDEKTRNRGSFYALQSREILADLQSEIEADAALLYDRLKAGERYDRVAWERWENVHGVWWRKLNAWLEHGKWYAEDLIKKVIEFPDSAYRDEWTVTEEQFPDAEAVRQFKRHRIIHSQWQESIEKVREGTSCVAFIGMSDTEVRRGKHPDK